MAKKVSLEKGQHDADGDHQLIHGNERAAHALRGDFREVERGDEGSHADGDAEEEARGDERAGRGGQGAENRADGEHEGADQDGAAAAEAQGKEPADEHAEDGAPEEGADDVFDGVVIDAEIFLDELVRAGDDADVETEEESGQRGGEADEVNDGFGFAGDGMRGGGAGGGNDGGHWGVEGGAMRVERGRD